MACIFFSLPFLLSFLKIDLEKLFPVLDTSYCCGGSVVDGWLLISQGLFSSFQLIRHQGLPQLGTYQLSLCWGKLLELCKKQVTDATNIFVLTGLSHVGHHYYISWRALLDPHSVHVVNIASRGRDSRGIHWCFKAKTREKKINIPFLLFLWFSVRFSHIFCLLHQQF